MDYQLIKSLYVQKGLSIDVLAEKVGMSRTGLSTAFRNNTLKIETLERIAEVLEVSPSYFFGGGSMDKCLSWIKLGVKIDVNNYLVGLVKTNSDKIGKKILELWENQPESKRVKYLSELLNNEEFNSIENFKLQSIQEMDVTLKFKVIIRFLIKNGFPVETSSSITKLSLIEQIAVFGHILHDNSQSKNLLEVAIDQTMLEFAWLISKDDTLRSLLKEGLLDSMDLINSSVSAFYMIFERIPLLFVPNIRASIRMLIEDGTKKG